MRRTRGHSSNQKVMESISDMSQSEVPLSKLNNPDALYRGSDCLLINTDQFLHLIMYLKMKVTLGVGQRLLLLVRNPLAGATYDK